MLPSVSRRRVGRLLGFSAAATLILPLAKVLRCEFFDLILPAVADGFQPVEFSGVGLEVENSAIRASNSSSVMFNSVSNDCLPVRVLPAEREQRATQTPQAGGVALLLQVVLGSTGLPVRLFIGSGGISNLAFIKDLDRIPDCTGDGIDHLDPGGFQS